jgi:hypothetical protein
MSLLFINSSSPHYKICKKLDISNIINPNKISIITYNNVNLTSNKFFTCKKQFKDLKNISPSNNLLHANMKENCNAVYNNTSTKINKAVFLHDCSGNHFLISHIFLDFINQINNYYELLVNDVEINIIMETVDTCYDTKFDNHPLNKFKQFLIDINIHNKLVFILNNSSDTNSRSLINFFDLFIEELYVTNYINNKQKEFDYLPLALLSSFNDILFYNRIIDIIKKKNSINTHYYYYKKKFLILESRKLINSRFIGDTIFDAIKSICEKYCILNNLKLILWDKEFTQRESLYEQFNISNNSEIIIGFAGSMFLHNYAMESGKLLMLNLEVENYNSSIVNLMTLYAHTNLIQNTNILKVFYFLENNNNGLLPLIVHNFLYDRTRLGREGKHTRLTYTTMIT